MNRFFVAALFLSLFISAKVVNKDSNGVVPNSFTDNLSPTEKAQASVTDYVQKRFGQDVLYKAYNFGQLFRLKKPEERQLDELKELKALVPSMKDHYGTKTDSVLHHYDSLIANKEKEIKEKNILSDYIISHVFTVKNKNNSGTAYEIDFILNHSFEVIDLKTKLAATLAKDDFDWFYYFFQRYPIFNSGNYERDVEQSNTIYDYYNNRLAVLKEGKEEFLLTALRVTRIINKTKKYDTDIICGFLVLKKLDDMAICDHYRPIKFSKSQEIRIQTARGDSLIGYKVFHKYDCSAADGKKETKAIYAELDAYFTPKGMLPVEQPFDKYFE